ncbi:LtfC-like domain-containing protein [Rhodococcus sp. AQ5-07]|uniref:LtfC-like domain-containing protein n=1 Tax=Rhodococcus sp. AQ5-07 TaxID=2054902 RepID=UPI0012B56E0D|nr:hypothetical protein [Rhodococcus sp. AQ5-07]
MPMGWIPQFDTIELNEGDWLFERTRDEGPFPAGTIAEIKWANGTTWAGEITADRIAWRIESAIVATIHDRTTFTAWVRYPNGNTGTTDDYPWIVGYAQRSPTESGF